MGLITLHHILSADDPLGVDFICERVYQGPLYCPVDTTTLMQHKPIVTSISVQEVPGELLMGTCMHCECRIIRFREPSVSVTLNAWIEFHIIEESPEFEDLERSSRNINV